MNFFVEFYKGLDAINLMIFWGVIIVVLLLLIFAIIIARKNRKLEKIIIENGLDLDGYDDELAIKRQPKEEKEETVTPVVNKEVIHEETIKEEPKIIVNTTEEESKEPKIIVNTVTEEPKEQKIIINTVHEEPKMPDVIVNHTVKEDIPVKEETFVAEEHVMEYKMPQVKIETEPREPYQHNVFRDSASATSPIGITIRHSDSQQEIAKARELHEILKDDTIPQTEINHPKDPVSESHLLNQRNYANTYKEPVRRGNYLDELSKKLASQEASNDITRTPYEIKQEEDAIISYQELLQKKDSIKTVDEEDAVISIDELLAKKEAEERIYNITKDEENDEFIKELKDFRSDL